MLSNPYTALLQLLPTSPLEVGTVSAIAGDLATVGLPGGGSIQARGSAGVGDRVFVRGGLIEGPAPSLSYVSAEV